MKIAILGTVGVPANYGGFETLAENLVRYHAGASLADGLTVYCSGKSYPDKLPTYHSAHLKYVPLHANGAQSILYDIWSLFSAVWHRSDVILLLGVSGAIALPLVRLISSADGMIATTWFHVQRKEGDIVEQIIRMSGEAFRRDFSDEK